MGYNLRVGVIQHKIYGSSDWLGQFKSVKEDIIRLSKEGAGLICLPELWHCGPVLKKEGDIPFNDASSLLSMLQALVNELNIFLICGMPESYDMHGREYRFNAAYLISHRKTPESYRKIHLFRPFGEDRIFSRGITPVAFWLNIEDGRATKSYSDTNNLDTHHQNMEIGIGPIICFDLRFPELSREYAIIGCSVIVCIALWPEERIGQFKALLRARAIENQCFVVGVNACGKKAGVQFGGASSIISPKGDVLYECGKEKEAFSLDLEIGLIKEARNRFLTARPKNWQIPISSKTLLLNDLMPIVKRRRASGQKCVFTNGCFDIIHAGHVAYLEEARRQGDFLVVGINSDSSVKKIKGSLRPINPEHIRASVIAGLGCVDYVTIFNETTPLQLIKSLMPDCLVKGEDWGPNDIVGADTVKKNGGSVYRIPFVHDISTTKIIGKIVASHKK